MAGSENKDLVSFVVGELFDSFLAKDERLWRESIGPNDSPGQLPPRIGQKASAKENRGCESRAEVLLPEVHLYNTIQVQSFTR